jgi:hypothetical protein
LLLSEPEWVLKVSKVLKVFKVIKQVLRVSKVFRVIKVLKEPEGIMGKQGEKIIEEISVFVVVSCNNVMLIE